MGDSNMESCDDSFQFLIVSYTVFFFESFKNLKFTNDEENPGLPSLLPTLHILVLFIVLVSTLRFFHKRPTPVRKHHACFLPYENHVLLQDRVCTQPPLHVV